MLNKIIISLGLGVVLSASVASANVGSIWTTQKTRTTSTMFSDAVANGIGDLVTIVVNLTTTATKDQSTDTSKTTSVDDALTTFMYQGNHGPLNLNYNGVSPAFNWTAANKFKGGGKVSNKETLTTTIQARVVDSLPNGTLQVEAKRSFEAGKEKGTLVLTGLVRREDLDVNNAIESTRIADLQIKQEGAGPLSREQRKGWLTTIYEFLNPF